MIFLFTTWCLPNAVYNPAVRPRMIFSDMDSLPSASSPRDADDAEVGSREGTRQEEEAPEVPQGNLPDFAPDSAPEPVVAPESGGRPLRKKGKTMTPVASVQPETPDSLL